MRKDYTNPASQEHELKQNVADGLQVLGSTLYGRLKLEGQTEHILPNSFSVKLQKQAGTLYTFQIFKANKNIGSVNVSERNLFIANRSPIKSITLFNSNGDMISNQVLEESLHEIKVSMFPKELLDFIHAVQQEVDERKKQAEQKATQPKPRVVEQINTSTFMREQDPNIYAHPRVMIRNKRYEDVNPEKARQVLESIPEISRLLPWLPSEIQKLFGFEPSQKTVEMTAITAEDFIAQMNALADLVNDGALEQFGPDATQLCMNLAVLVTKYIHEKFHFPLVGLYNPEDEKLENYVRPITTLFDRQPVYSEFINQSGRFSMEDCVEVKIGDRKFVVDYNYFYQAEERAFLTEELTGQKNLGSKQLLIFEVTTEEQRKNLNKLGIITTQYAGFDPQELSPEAKNWYEGKLRNFFMIVVGDPIADAGYRASLTSDTAHYFVNGDSSSSVADYINTMSAGALISRGAAVNDLTGRGLNFILDDKGGSQDTAHEHRLLLKMMDANKKGRNSLLRNFFFK